MNYAIVKSTTLEVLNVYWSPTGQPEPVRVNAKDSTVNVVVGNDLDYHCIKAVSSNGQLSIVHDDAKLAAKRARQFSDLRQKRNDLLTACDWTQSNDSPLSEDSKNAWKQYRTDLRNLTSVTSDPKNPTWPVPPL